ncbi:dihydroorotate dehydrogenase [Rhodovulum kholense]|uniref:Dihydroorotate dehydrogenase n=1 Tax=Rhodovulum kholense TaxID=453584 RepID=A0A8E2VLA3_9RHOB|nr:dihydroorotate dehydrogenase [Rhodovulum kholense]PTW50978.1 hypothetical protein C8N38_103214 [Rhodovulum kholense]
MTDPRMNDHEIEALFAAARAERAEPSAALMARIMDDAMIAAAEAAAPRPVAPRPVAAQTGRRGLLAVLVAAIGGWPALAGVATAGVFGLWIGYAGPGDVGTLTATILGSAYGPNDLVPSLDTYLTEG